jgi:hypothetical protein
MSDWSKNHRAHTTTWSTLLLLHQNARVFRESGAVPMSGLTYWNSTGSADIRKLQVATLVQQLDNVFRMIRGAKYEPGLTHETAIEALTAVLQDPAKTICDLANTADTCYRFYAETDDG